MKLLENQTILILEPSDRSKKNYNPSNVYEFVKSFDFEIVYKVSLASLILYIDDDGTTTILKNKYGKDQLCHHENF